MLMLKLAALFATAIAAVQCVLAERVLKVEQHVAEIQVVSSDANARLLNLGFNKAMAIDLPTDIKEVLVAESQTVRVVVRTFRRVYIVGAAVGRTNIFFYADDGRQVVALDVSVSETSQVPPPELRDASALHRTSARSVQGVLALSPSYNMQQIKMFVTNWYTDELGHPSLRPLANRI
jgi:Flp pilus assembly secretin CpaC